MHIAFLLPDLKGGGAQKMVVNLANWFAANGEAVDLVLCNADGIYRNLISEQVNVIDFNKRRTFLATLPLSQYLKKQQPDILFSALYHVNIVAVLGTLMSKVQKTKLVISERNYFSRSDAAQSGYWKFLIRKLYPFSNYIVGISHGVCDDLKKLMPNLPDDKIGTIYNPVVGDNFEAELAMNVPNIFPDGAKVKIITSGRFVPQKDYPTLLKSFALFQKKNPNTHLVILGQGVLETELKALVNELDIQPYVTFAGFVDNPLAYIRQADIFLMTSAWEGFCNVLVEALYCGVNIVATDCPSGPAEILEKSKYGTLCPVGDVDAIAEAIEERLKILNPPEVQKIRALHFHVDKIGMQFKEKFESL